MNPSSVVLFLSTAAVCCGFISTVPIAGSSSCSQNSNVGDRHLLTFPENENSSQKHRNNYRGIACIKSDSVEGDESQLNASKTDDTRTRKTWVDIFFQKQEGIKKQLPLPPILHANLEDLIQQQGIVKESPESEKGERNILIVGDVHGCYEELLTLVETARSQIKNKNNKNDFDVVILVGDLCNKGPDSLKIIQHARKTPNWFSVRGNHDEGALRAMLGDEAQLKKSTYQWVQNDDINGNDDDKTTDKDVEWFANLPYTITIPSSFFLEEQKDTIIVHAGLIPDVPLVRHDNKYVKNISDDDGLVKTTNFLEAMITMRNVEKHTFTDFKASQQNQQHYYTVTNRKENASVTPWASQWKGPERIIFGHDAKRGLQLYYFAQSKKDIMVAGLDTGVCYGNELTGIILPSQTLVHVPAQNIYSPIQKK